MEPRRMVEAAAVTAGAVGVAGGALGVLGWGARTLLRRQAAAARALIGKPLGEHAPDADKVYRKRYAGPPIELLLLGDSIAAGLGADDRRGTLGARLAKGLAQGRQQRVRLTTAAVVGSESRMLAAQLAGLDPSYRPDLAVVVVGGNDVAHRVPVPESVAHLVAAVEDLRARGVAVVVGTCPDLGMLAALAQPLRGLASRASRQLAAAQAVAAVRAGAHVVLLGDVVRPFFDDPPEDMFSLDRFHPSAYGYRRTAEAMLPSVLAAARGAEPQHEPAPEPSPTADRGRGVTR